MNSTDLSSPVTLTIPASVGPSADYYSIAIADITTGQASTYSNTFNFTGGTGNYTEYESHLGGAPFWDANDLPCSSYDCARGCAQAGYPDDLTEDSAYQTMKSCFLKCNDVTPAPRLTAPALAAVASPSSAGQAVITLSDGQVLTAVETVITTGGSTITEAVVGSMTLTLGGAGATVRSEALSLATNGLAVGASTTVAFSGSTASATTDQAMAATSSAAAVRQEVVAVGMAGVAGLAALLI